MADKENGVELYASGAKPKKSDLVNFVLDKVNIANYYGRSYIEHNDLWKRLGEDEFKSVCYAVFGSGIPAAHIRDLSDYFLGSHNILSTPSKLIYFDGMVWDMDKCDFVLESIDKTFFRSPIKPNMEVELGQNEFVKALAVGDMDVYADIFSTLSVMFSSRKPDMVGFFYGDGSNGKSVLIDVMNKVVGDHIASINLERLTDQRDAPLINGTLANLCGENADNIIIEDSQVFKSIGSHERWTVHRMHTNDVIEIDTNPLHIFCVNNMPNFKDKSSAIIRRARVVPFKNKFDQDPNFRNNLLNDEQFLSDFLGEMLIYAQKGKEDGWVSPLSQSTLDQIEEYDILRNSAKTFIDEYIELGMVGFKNFNILKQNYENWCKDNSFTQMGVKTFRSSVMKYPFDRKNTSDNKEKIYMLEDYTVSDAQYKVGLYYKGDVHQEELELDVETKEKMQSVMDLF